MKIKFKDIEDQQFRLENLIAKYLEERGWRYTSDTIGCYWMWEKKWNKKVLLMTQEDALSVEKEQEYTEN